MTHYVIDRQQSLGNKLANSVALCDAAISEITEVYDAMDAGRSGPGGADYTLISGGDKGFGIATGQGEAVFTALTALKTAIDTFEAASAACRSQLRQE